MSGDEHIENTPLAVSFSKAMSALIRGLCEAGTKDALAKARAIVEMMRIACDEATARINEASRANSGVSKP